MEAPNKSNDLKNRSQSAKKPVKSSNKINSKVTSKCMVLVYIVNDQSPPQMMNTANKNVKASNSTREINKNKTISNNKAIQNTAPNVNVKTERGRSEQKDNLPSIQKNNSIKLLYLDNKIAKK
jgi:hypothetical protein